ncbi:MAG: transcription-repair coupling factor [Flavobacteriales bacterium]|nr:transcription-repair coupling factor [Flavobacteriales bacterium]
MQVHRGTHLVVMPDKESAAYFHNDLESLYTDTKVLFFPRSARVPYATETTENANISMRAEVLNEINKEHNLLIVVSFPEALAEKVTTKKQLTKNTFDVKVGDHFDMDFIDEAFHEFGFAKVDYVYEPGQYSVRGGIVDVFSFSFDHPYRIEFFGDEVESIRKFEPDTQLSIGKMARATIIPSLGEKLIEESSESFFEFIGGDTVFWYADYQGCAHEMGLEFEKAERQYEKLEALTNHLEPSELYIGEHEFKHLTSDATTVEFGSRRYFVEGEIVTFDLAVQPAFAKNFDMLSTNLANMDRQGYKTLISSGQPKQIERLYSIFEDKDHEVHFTPLTVELSEGFVDKEQKLLCYTDHQIFERYHRFRLKEGFAKNKEALTLREINQLQTGDYVVHIDHGIGQFAGLHKIEVNGKEQEAIRLTYKDGDVLYVSIHSLHRISKFTSKDGGQPKINKLGTQAWQNLKKKTKTRVKEIAYDLLKLYAKRKTTPGFAYTPDTYLQTELEASFMYEDTPDQVTATEDVKKDMESPHPMDRLVCGDVGFGKTEIAVRAAFKAVSDSKQVAILVPTTILSLQHYKSFKARLAEFPCKVDYLNRFKSAKKKTDTLKRLQAGEIDIIIGTHALVGKSVKFKDLGLLIIDEEQKFGVSVKDKLKTLKANVDTLTLTATPIPRTLQFSMMGARDLSILRTPPANRYPIQTEICPFNEEIIRDAVSYEISRGGQVYFVHNRIANIKEVAGMIQRLVPDVRVGIGHGQMDGAKLEEIMGDFIDGAYDVLLATTIIESGIDIANANTIIINEAQNYGLSDLHQLRGRVGRSNKKAFCYLLAPPMHLLPSDSRKRLQALEQFSDLGSGMNIAMRDLDIRGAGNLLGAEQSGFMADIGIETYQKILEEAMQELKQDEFRQMLEEEEVESQQFVRETALETDFEILFPDDYVSQISERISLYKELDGCNTERELKAFTERLIDRFGPLPDQAKDLIQTIRMRWLASEIGFEKLIIKSGKLIGYFVSREDSPYYQSESFTRILDFMKHNPREGEMYEKAGGLRMKFDAVETIEKAVDILQRLRGVDQLQD